MSLVITEQTAPRRAWPAEFRATLALAWPLVLTNLAQIAMNTTDVIVLGRLGPEALAAGTLGVNLYFALLIFGIGIVTATAPMMAEALGRKRKSVRDVRRTFRQGLWSAALLSVIAWGVLWQAETLMIAFGIQPQLATDAGVFVHALQWGFLPALGGIVLRSFVSALERPFWALWATATAVLFNGFANWVLVFGHLGFPATGLRGSGLATALSSGFLFLALASVVVRHRMFRRYHLFGRWWRADWPRFAALWRLGLPIGATMAFEITVFNAAVFVMGQFGTESIAAHAIAIQIAATCFMVPMGLAQAATVRVGRAFGARDRDGIGRAGWSAFALAMAFMTATSVVLFLAPRPLIGAFVSLGDPANAGVIDLAVSFLFCAAVFQIADGAQVVGAGMLRGLQDARMPMLYAAMGYWGFGASLSLIFAFGFGLRGQGIWIGLASGLAIVALMMMRRWIRRERLGLVGITDAHPT